MLIRHSHGQKWYYFDQKSAAEALVFRDANNGLQLSFQQVLSTNRREVRIFGHHVASH